MLEAQQQINGISFETYETDPELYDNTLKDTVADSLDGVSADNVVDLTVSPSRRRRLEERLQQRQLQTDSIIADYRIEVRILGTTADELAAELEDAVTSGEFTMLMQSNAASMGATGLVNATTDSIRIEIIEIEDDDENNGGNNKSKDDEDKLTDGELAGVIIGSFFGFLLLLALFYFAYVYFISNSDVSDNGSENFSSPAAIPSPPKKGTQLGRRSDSRNSCESAEGPFMNQSIIDL